MLKIAFCDIYDQREIWHISQFLSSAQLCHALNDTPPSSGNFLLVWEHPAMCFLPKSSNWRWVNIFLLLAFCSVYMKYLLFATHASSPRNASWNYNCSIYLPGFLLMFPGTRNIFFFFPFCLEKTSIIWKLLIFEVSLTHSLPWDHSGKQAGFVGTWFKGGIILPAAYHFWNINPLCIILLRRIFQNCWLPDNLRLLSNVWNGTYLILFLLLFIQAALLHTSNHGLCEW